MRVVGNATAARTSSSWRSSVRSAVGSVFALALCALVSGCATRADLLKVQHDQREVRALLADTQVAVDSLRRRVDAMRSQADDGGRPARSSGRSTDALERRIAELEGKLQAQASPAPGQPAPPPVPTPPVPSSGDAQVVPTPSVAEPVHPATPRDAALAKEEAAMASAQGVDDDYREGLRAVRASQCDQAVPRLRSFLRKNPKSDLADNAQYWIGECYYSQKDYNKAIIELNEVLLKYSKGDKVPAALFTLASAFADSGDKIDARLILQKLISDHPKSEEAERGRQKLQSLGD